MATYKISSIVLFGPTQTLRSNTLNNLSSMNEQCRTCTSYVETSSDILDARTDETCASTSRRSFSLTLDASQFAISMTTSTRITYGCQIIIQ